MRIALTIQVAGATALGGLVAAMAGALAGESLLDVHVGVVVRAVLVAALLLAVPPLLVGRHVLSTHRRELALSGLVGVLVGYALTPSAWDGRAFVTQLVVAPGPLTVVLDLVCWAVVGGAAVALASRAAPAGHQPLGYQA